MDLPVNGSYLQTIFTKCDSPNHVRSLANCVIIVSLYGMIWYNIDRKGRKMINGNGKN